MKLKTVFLIVVYFFGITACNDKNPDSVSMVVYKASENISSNVDVESITDSLFQQFRPNVQINKMYLSESEIDDAVRKYTQENYTPILIKNYSQIFTKLKGSRANFQSCEILTPIDTNSDVLESLCLVEEGKEAIVNYMTNGYGQGWSLTSSFTFTLYKKNATLTSIDINMESGVKVSVEGI